MVGSELEVVRNFTWAVLVMEGGNFRIHEVSLDGTPNFVIHASTFLAVVSVASQLLLYLFWISLRLGIGLYNTLVSKICVKILKPPKIQIPTAELPFGFANTFMISLHALCTPKLRIPLYYHE